MVAVKTPEEGLPKTKQILVALQVDGPMCGRQLKDRFGEYKSMLSNLIRAGCVESYLHFNPHYGDHWSRKEVTFYAATGVPYVSKRMPVCKKPHNYLRDKERSIQRIPQCIAYLEKWGYEVIYKGESNEANNTTEEN